MNTGEPVWNFLAVAPVRGTVKVAVSCSNSAWRS
jgi:hypothetical protein